MYVPTRGSWGASGSLRLGFVLVMTVCVQWTISVLNETLEVNTLHSRWRSLDRLAIEEHWAGTFAALSHDDKGRTVTLDLTGEDTACPQPVVRARLSGPALVLLSWTRYEKKLVGRYDAPISGKYFIEVIVLACSQMTREWTMQEVRDMCIADVTTHRVSQKNSSIFITQASTLIDGIGTWMQTAEIRLPLYTRVQPPACSNCVNFTSTGRFAGYMFNFSHEHALANRSKKQLAATSHKLGSACFVGASHSRTMVELLTQKYPTLFDLVHVDTKWPSDLLNASQQVLLSNCSTAVVGIGQWPAGWPEKHPMSFEEYETNMRRSLAEFVRRTKDKGVRTFSRNTHENPLGRIISSCPPSDWRNPEVIRINNELLQNISQDLRIPYLMTTDITGPLWDSAPDWCHYKNDVGLIEALFILQSISTYDSG